jgi:predicted DNA-binding protein with PD1-like motif
MSGVGIDRDGRPVSQIGRSETFFVSPIRGEGMDYLEVGGAREFVARLSHGEDWRGQIESFAAEKDLDAAFFVGLGAVQDAEILYYDQEDEEYYPETFDEPLEMAACVGNVSELDGEPFAHTHAVLSREDGSTVAGHLNRATTFAGELYVREFDVPLDDRYIIAEVVTEDPIENLNALLSPSLLCDVIEDDDASELTVAVVSRNRGLRFDDRSRAGNLER